MVMRTRRTRRRRRRPTRGRREGRGRPGEELACTAPRGGGGWVGEDGTWSEKSYCENFYDLGNDDEKMYGLRVFEKFTSPFRF